MKQIKIIKHWVKMNKKGFVVEVDGQRKFISTNKLSDLVDSGEISIINIKKTNGIYKSISDATENEKNRSKTIEDWLYNEEIPVEEKEILQNSTIYQKEVFDIFQYWDKTLYSKEDIINMKNMIKSLEDRESNIPIVDIINVKTSLYVRVYSNEYANIYSIMSDKLYLDEYAVKFVMLYLEAEATTRFIPFEIYVNKFVTACGEKIRYITLENFLNTIQEMAKYFEPIIGLQENFIKRLAKNSRGYGNEENLKEQIYNKYINGKHKVSRETQEIMLEYMVNSYNELIKESDKYYSDRKSKLDKDSMEIKDFSDAISGTKCEIAIPDMDKIRRYLNNEEYEDNTEMETDITQELKLLNLYYNMTISEKDFNDKENNITKLFNNKDMLLKALNIIKSYGISIKIISCSSKKFSISNTPISSISLGFNKIDDELPMVEGGTSLNIYYTIHFINNSYVCLSRFFIFTGKSLEEIIQGILFELIFNKKTAEMLENPGVEVTDFTLKAGKVTMLDDKYLKLYRYSKDVDKEIGIKSYANLDILECGNNVILMKMKPKKDGTVEIPSFITTINETAFEFIDNITKIICDVGKLNMIRNILVKNHKQTVIDVEVKRGLIS